MRRLSCLLWLSLAGSAFAQTRPDVGDITLVRAVVTSSINRNSEPRRPLETLKLPSAVFYYVEAAGFQPGYNYQVRIVVLDGAKNVLGEHYLGTVPQHARHVVWLPIIARETHAPGSWTFRMYFGTSQPASRLVAETGIEASADGGKAAGLERYAALVALAVLATLAYVAYGMYTHRHFEVGLVTRAAPPGHDHAASLGDASLLALVAANLLPLAFAVFGGANAADMLFLYWVENLIVLFYAILRMISARGAGPPRLLGTPAELGLVFLIPVVIVLFGIFSYGHVALLWHFAWQHSTLFALDARTMLDAKIAAQFEGAGRELWDVLPFAMVLQAAALLVSHGISFVRNYLAGGEYRRATPKEEMIRPVNRVGIMQAAMFAAGFMASNAGSPLAALFVLALLKTGIDVAIHRRLHRPPALPA